MSIPKGAERLVEELVAYEEMSREECGELEYLYDYLEYPEFYYDDINDNDNNERSTIIQIDL